MAKSMHMLQEWQKASLVQTIQETANTRRFFFKLHDLESFNFEPGQFVTLDLPIHEKKNKRWRSYSIASAPDGTNVIELLIVLVPDGPGTNYIFYNLKEGDEVLLRGPQGHFTEPPSNYENLLMICTGTGIAPFRSMLNCWRNKNCIKHKNVFLIMGTRTQADLLYHQELLEIEKQMPNFRYLPTLSREKWIGRSGYVHDIYEEICKNKPDAGFMLCGWKNMVDEARKRIEAMGYDKKMIHFELYG